MALHPSRFIVPLAAVLALSACSGSPETTTPEPEAKPEEPAKPEVSAEDKELLGKAQAAFKALPAEAPAGENQLTDERIDLGRMLYYENRLSKNHDISCNSCHQLDNYGVDNEPTSPGHKGVRGDRNSPTVYNAAFHVSQFWDGRAKDVEEQAGGPVLNSVEMAMPSEDYVLTVLKSIPAYDDKFKAAFPGEEDPITYANMASAIGAFERKLVTPAPFDAYLGGDVAALTDQQKKGLKLYMDTGCQTCHMGVALGGASYMKMGLVKPYETEDEGRKAVTGNDTDLHVFKVPSLRNIEKTGPYFHDGSITELDVAVKLMADHQLGKELTDEQVADITAFLGSLTGELPTEYIAKPELPESGPDTPKADPS